MREVRGAQDRHAVPGPAHGARPRLHGRATSWWSCCASGRRCRKRAAREVSIALLERVGIADARRAAEGLPAPTVRGHRTARDGRDGGRARARGAARRRADVLARRHGAGAGARAARLARRRDRDGDGPDHAQPGGGGRARRPHRRDVRGPHRRARPRSRRVRRRRSIRTRRGCCGRSPTSRCARSDCRASRARRRTCCACRPAARSIRGARWPTTDAARRCRRSSRSRPAAGARASTPTR